MKKLHILWARVRCCCFQLWMPFRHGRWYQEVLLYGRDDQVLLVGALEVSIDSDWKIDSVFYNNTEVKDSTWCSPEAAKELKNFMWRVK